jgi:hypothetical protein
MKQDLIKEFKDQLKWVDKEIERLEELRELLFNRIDELEQQ